ncbi:MAG: hypothetical protein ABIQ95_07510 [Bdellovibrionia bacterium]
MKINKQTKFLKLLPLITLLGIGSVAFAGGQSEHREESDQGDQNAYVGALIGGNRNANSNGTISDTATNPTYGLTAGIKISPRFGIGFFGSRYDLTSSGAFLGLPVGTSTSTTMLLGQGNFFIGGIHVGVEAGPTTSSWDGKIASLHDGSSNTSMVYGPHGGIDMKLDKTITLGGEFHYLFSTAQNVASNAQALAAIKIWL